MTRLILITFMLLSLVTFRGAAEDKALPEPEVIDTPEFQNKVARVGATYISGQPTQVGLKWMKDQGVTHVISVRTPSEHDNRDIVQFDEKAEAEALGLTWVNVPMGGKDHPYTPEALAQVAEALKAAEGKALLHCTVGWRASHVWAAYLTEHQGVEPNKAVAHARKIQLTEQPFEALLGSNIRYERVEKDDQ